MGAPRSQQLGHRLRTKYLIAVTDCMQWGGEEMARSFCVTTDGWSHWWLNDVTQSRRPWLHRTPRPRGARKTRCSSHVLSSFHETFSESFEKKGSTLMRGDTYIQCTVWSMQPPAVPSCTFACDATAKRAEML